MATRSEQNIFTTDKDWVDKKQVNADEFLSEERCSDREFSEKIVDDVIGAAKTGLDGLENVPEEVLNKLRDLWLSKLSSKDFHNPLDEDSDSDESDESYVVAAAGSSSLSSVTSARTKQSPPRVAKRKRPTMSMSQLDGPNDSSDDDEDLDPDDDDDDDDDDNDDDLLDDDEEVEDGADEEPLGSGDDISDEDPSDLFNTANVVVCQYDKITRARNKWKFHLKDGIMNLNGKDYVFQRATGDAEW